MQEGTRSNTGRARKEEEGGRNCAQNRNCHLFCFRFSMERQNMYSLYVVEVDCKLCHCSFSQISKPNILTHAKDIFFQQRHPWLVKIAEIIVEEMKTKDFPIENAATELNFRPLRKTPLARALFSISAYCIHLEKSVNQFCLLNVTQNWA